MCTLQPLIYNLVNSLYHVLLYKYLTIIYYTLLQMLTALTAHIIVIYLVLYLIAQFQFL